ncbi:metal-dependent hydrolase [Enhygromyxa salina]|uniref:Putative metal-dependent hydrolase n=1 Tax=Enhygromyxa salina TaxID=215803 RepID=A0A2S9YVN5_9BACT|nr:metal-dependent hydrolase [Enhygromyxa salina]PRQ09165.1 putative metal-dependent hydrolase [Enhygromyxa salina]
MKLPVQAQELFDRVRSRANRSTSQPAAPTRDPIVRRMKFDFDGAEIPRHWAGGSPVWTAIANSLNLVFPDGERFFVRSVNHFMDELDPVADAELRDRVKRFYGQEGQHAHEHERLFEIIRGHGYDIDAFLRPYRRIAYQWLAPKVPPKLRLSITAALEHFTATFAEQALTLRVLDEFAPPVMAELLLWHAAEEIEHKDVAYEVLQRIDDSYSLRAAGLVAATIVLTGFWLHGIVVLLRQEPDLRPAELARDYAAVRAKGQGIGATMPAAFMAYLAPDFHPSKVPNDALALEYLESIGRRHG